MLWVLRAQCRDREALEALLRSVQPALRRYLAGLAGAAEADDILQDVLVIIVRKIGTLEDPALFRPWMFRIASRQAFRHLKKRRLWRERRDEEADLDELPMPPTPDDGLLHELLEGGAVSPSIRAVLLLHFEQGMTLPEAAAVLGIPVGTAKSRLAYGLRTIRKHLNLQEAHS